MMNRFAKTILAASFASLAAVLSVPGMPLPAAHAAQQASIALSPEQKEAVARVNAYLNSFKTLRGEFVQTGPSGRIDKGLLFISKPGKLRFDYAPPSALLVASDGKWLTVKNKVRERGDQYPLNATPFRYFVAPKINLAADATIVGVETQDGITQVALADKQGVIRGQLLLMFDEARGELTRWISIDSRGQRQTVDVSNLETNVQLDPKLFQVTIKRKERDKK